MSTDPLNLCNVLKVIGPKNPRWYTIGIFLELTEEDLDVIVEDHSTTEMKCIKMVQTWLRMKPYATWTDLREALEQIGENSLAAKISQLQPQPQKESSCENVNISPPETPVGEVSLCIAKCLQLASCSGQLHVPGV